MTFKLNNKKASAIREEKQAELRREVDQERDRRIYAGGIVTVEGYGNIPVQGRPQDQVNLLALKDTARDLMDAGLTEVLLTFRDGANVHHDLTPYQMKTVADEGKRTASAIYQAAWALKAMDPVPEDYADDQYWPT